MSECLSLIVVHKKVKRIMKTLTTVVFFVVYLSSVLGGGDQYLVPMKLMQRGNQMFVLEQRAEDLEAIDDEVLGLELITPANELIEATQYAPTCDNSPFYGTESCTFDCPIDGWKLELDAAGCCCFYFETETQDDLELVYSEF